MRAPPLPVLWLVRSGLRLCGWPLVAPRLTASVAEHASIRERTTRENEIGNVITLPLPRHTSLTDWHKGSAAGGVLGMTPAECVGAIAKAGGVSSRMGESEFLRRWSAPAGASRAVSADDQRVLRAILREARAACGLSDRLTVLHMLQAYEEVLPRFGLEPQDDHHYYRLLLQHSLDAEPTYA